MLSGIAKTGLALLLLALAFEACSTPSGKSTGTNWIVCKTDADCKGRPGTHCAESKRCEGDAGPPPVGETDASIEGNGGAVGNTGIGGASGTAVGTGGGPGFGGLPIGAGGLPIGAGGFPIGAGGDTGGAQGAGGADTAAGGGFPLGNGGAAGAPHPAGCYSPGQNLGTSWVPDAFGCKCIQSQTPDGLCLKMPDPAPGALPSAPGAYVCVDGHWKADTNNTACTGCWTPDQPEFANASPDNGCACVNEGETECIVTQNEGYNHAVCKGGRWKLDPTLNSCACTSDARCGFGGKCVDQACARRVCEVDGVRYAVGVQFPSPTDGCNTCECDAQGHLTCSTNECASTTCPSGTVQASACVGCGLADGCGLWRFGCLPRCETNAECARTGTPACDPTDHVCNAGGCP